MKSASNIRAIVILLVFAFMSGLVPMHGQELRVAEFGEQYRASSMLSDALTSQSDTVLPPVVSDLRRNIVIPAPTDAVTVSCTVEAGDTSRSISTVVLLYGTPGTELGRVNMNYDTNSGQAVGEIPAQEDGSVVWYAIEATDDSSATTVFPEESERGKAFFIVRDGITRIRDVQYTPFSDGISGAVGGTVTVRGVVMGSASEVGMLYLQDAAEAWSGIAVHGDASVRNLPRGQHVTITGTVEERDGVTTLADATLSFDHGVGVVFPTVELSTGTFENMRVEDGDPIAEQWEGMLVLLRNVRITSTNPASPPGSEGDFLVTDGSGDMRVGSSGAWTNTYTTDRSETDKIFLTYGTTIETLSGHIHSESGAYKLEPRSDEDFVNVVLGPTHPVISNVLRNQAIPSSSDDVVVTCRVVDSNPYGNIELMRLVYGAGDVERGRTDMLLDPDDNIATAVIPAQQDGELIWYYIEAEDNDGEEARYPVDLDGPRPFFIVRDGNIRIRDIQYTPYADGRSGSAGYSDVLTRGVLTAGPKLGMYFIQDAAAPWSGIQIVSSDIGTHGLRPGDDITVRGIVDEVGGMTQLRDIVLVENHGVAPLPDALLLNTGMFETGVAKDGDFDAEPYESMLVRFDRLVVTSINADAAQGENHGEFLVSDGSGDMRVDDAGVWDEVFTTDPTDLVRVFLPVGSKIASLIGVMYYSNNNFKLEPRDEDDFFNVVTSVEHVPGRPDAVVLHPNHPNPFMKHEGTTLRFEIPEHSLLSLSVYNTSGTRVATLLDGWHAAGEYSMHFTAQSLAPGMYFCTLMIGEAVHTTRMILVH